MRQLFSFEVRPGEFISNSFPGFSGINRENDSGALSLRNCVCRELMKAIVSEGERVSPGPLN